MKIVITASLEREETSVGFKFSEGKAIDRMMLLLNINQAIEDELEILQREIPEACETYGLTADDRG